MNAEEYRVQGDSYQKQRDFDHAIECYTQAIQLNPQLTAAYVNRGMARRAKGDMDGAIADYTEAIRVNPQNAIAYNNRGYTRYQKGDHRGAIADCDEAIRLNGTQSFFYHSRALPRAALGDYAGATADFQQSLQLMPNHPKAQFMRDKIAEWGPLIASKPQPAAHEPDFSQLANQSVIRPIAPPPSRVPAARPQAAATGLPGGTADVSQAFDAFFNADKPVKADDGSNLMLGIFGGIGGAIAGAILWGVFTAVTGIELGLIAIGIGFLVGYGVRLLGKGEDPRFGVVGAILAFLGCLGGNILAIIIIVGRQDVRLAGRLLLSPAVIFQVMGRTFSPIDALFYIIAVYEGYRFSFGMSRQRARVRR